MFKKGNVKNLREKFTPRPGKFFWPPQSQNPTYLTASYNYVHIYYNSCKCTKLVSIMVSIFCPVKCFAIMFENFLFYYSWV